MALRPAARAGGRGCLGAPPPRGGGRGPPRPTRTARRGNTLANLVRGHLRADGADAAAAKAVTLLLERLARVRLVPQAHDPALYDIVYDDGVFDDGDTLSDPKVLDVVVPAVEELARQDWQAAGALRSVLANWLARRPAGEGLPGSAGM